jgi:transaldolase
MATKTYQRYRGLLTGQRWQRLAAAGARPRQHLHQRPRRAGHAVHLRAGRPDTINTMPEKRLEAFADHGTVGDLLPTDGGDADEVLAEFGRAGIRDRCGRAGREAPKRW